MIRLAVAGATGRTGRCVLDLALRDDRFEIAAALTTIKERQRWSTVRAGDVELAIRDKLEVPCDVLVDFTVASGTIAWLDVCAARGLPMVIGTTGHDEHQVARIEESARVIPIVKASNFSIGIQTMLNMVGRLAKQFGDAYDIEVVEAHHRHKTDSPSGTALALIDEILTAAGRVETRDVVHGRQGQVGPRPRGQIGVHAIRMGQVIGQHEIHFGGPGETLTIRHIAHSREIFAAGALRASAWIVRQGPGLYSMREVIA